MSETPRIIDAQFLKSAPSLVEAVEESRSEVVFLGRSNVGKSSTINTLCNRKNLAKSSATPGKTQLINFFDVRYRLGEEDYPLRFVDLPGFGYARVSKSLKELWQKNLVEYITQRVAIRLFVHLRDARHPHEAIDDEVERYVRGFLRPDQRYLPVFTKGDKLKQKELAALRRDFPDAIVLSNLKKRGHDRLHREIFTTVFGAME
ncbi:ribosome biogenesis GTP-binding protein YihA/YsxC [Nitratifractor sp.]